MPQHPEKRALERSTLFVTSLTSFIGPFMISSVNVALPAIQKELGIDAVLLSWIATAYLLSVAVVLVPAGKIGDIYGRKRVFVTGLLTLSLASLLAALSKGIFLLMLSRILQGAGAAMSVTTGMAILTSVFPPQERGRVIGIYVAAVYIGLSAGPLVGGIMTQHLGWRSIFVLLVPMGLAAVALTLRFLKQEWKDEKIGALDIMGSCLYGTAIMALVWGATQIPSSTGILSGAVGLAGLVLFYRHQQRVAFPVMEVTLFKKNKTFTFSSLAALLNYSATYAVTFLMSLYLQYIKGMSPRDAGLVLMSQPLLMALFSPLAGRLSDRIDPRLLATGGMFCTLLGVLFFTGLTAETPLGLILANLVLLGFAFALFSSPNMSTIMGSVDLRHYTAASGTVATMRLLGQMTSMAIATLVLAWIMGPVTIGEEHHDRFLVAVRTIFACSALLCTAGISFSWFRGNLRGGREP
ncbi:MAG: MFS transporter [Desulfobulbus propionicus]|nr:MAG: MFS transporter [Desulfobulbus propionicus]